MIDRSIFRPTVRWAAAITICLFLAVPAAAQNFNPDARRIAMGGVGDQNNAALRLAGDARSYRSIPVPLGLFQVLSHPKVFDPGDDEFNPIRALEYLSNPLHWTFNREESPAGEMLVKDLVNGTISWDLNAYRGFAPESSLTARGLVSPDWGKTVRIHEDPNSVFHGMFVGAGPYLSIGTDMAFDQNLVNILKSSTNTYSPNSSFFIDDTSDGQAAMAITGGYRLRLPVPGRPPATDRDGIYLAANYNYLQGFHYETDALRVRFDTDAQGLVTVAPTTTPLVIRREKSSTGRGFGIDIATAVALGGFDFGFAANGIANRIKWDDLEAEQHTLSSLAQGSSFSKTTLPAPVGKRKIALPVRYSARGAYSAGRWTVDLEAGRGLQGKDFHGGAEYRFGLIELRGGGRYSRSVWNPTGGIGLNLFPGFGIDIAAFGTSTNIERQRKTSLAVSLRLGGD